MSNPINKLISTSESVIINLPTRYGDFSFYAVDDNQPNCTVMLFKGDLASAEAPIVRLHSECLTGDVFGSLRCDCGEQLEDAMNRINKEGVGAVIYLRQEGRGIGLFNKIKTYKLQEQGYDTVDANKELGLEVDTREYSIPASILRMFNVKKVRLITNNPQKIKELEEHGIEVVDRISIKVKPCEHNSDYLQTKKKRMGHLLSDDE